MSRWIKRTLIATFIILLIAYVYYAINNAGVISVHYADSPDPQHKRIKRSLEAWRGFDVAAARLDSTFLLPHNLEVWFVDCGQENALYNPQRNQIALCYELVTALIRGYAPLARSESNLSTAVWHTTFFVFYHEFGHALVHLFDLPITGREEDVVDQLATMVLLNGGEEGSEAALQGATWFLLNSRTHPSTPYWNEHALDQQRYFNILCWVYGSNPQAHQVLLGPAWGLPLERAARCPAEYQQIARAWVKLLAFHTE